MYISDRVTDGVLAEVLEDSRVAKNHDELWQTLSEDMLALVEIPDHVWSAVAEVAERSAEDLRAACIAGGHVSYHFFCRRVLEPAGELPWKLVRGDKAENLRELASGPMPEEPVSQQMWKLLQFGFSSLQLESVLDLMADAPWSTLPAEQQHGSLAVLRRWHPEYSTTTLSARALLVQLRRLLPTFQKMSGKLARLARQLDRTLSKNPTKSGGRQEFLSELFKHLRSRSWSHSTRDVPADMTAKLFQHHAKSRGSVFTTGPATLRITGQRALFRRSRISVSGGG